MDPCWGCLCFGSSVSAHQLLRKGGRVLRAQAVSSWPPACRHLVNAGVLTVRDAGSWWLAVPGAGRFIKCFVKGMVPQGHPLGVFRSSSLTHLPFPGPSPPGRQAVLSMVRKAKYRELALSELLGRRAPSAVRLGLAYHVHDLIGAQLVDW